MWKRRSVTTVKETPASSARTSAQGSAPSAPRVYKLTQVLNLRQFKIEEHPSPTVVYTLTFTPIPHEWGMILSDGGPEKTLREDVVIVGAAKISHHQPVIEMALGNPMKGSDTFQPVEAMQEAQFPTKIYNLSLLLPPLASDASGAAARVLELQWKSTNKAKGFMKAVDRGMHHKLIDKKSDTLLARYSHNPWSKDVEGTVEIFADIAGYDPLQWERFVLLTGLAITEKTLMWGYAKLGANQDARYAHPESVAKKAAVAGGAGLAGGVGLAVHETAETIEAVAETIAALAFVG